MHWKTVAATSNCSMKALPSIAFNEFAGSAGDVTARSVKGRTLLNHKAYQSRKKTPAQASSRNSLSKISRAYKQLTDSQMSAWAVLAGHMKGISTLGDAASMTAHNAFVRINTNRQLVGMPLLTEAPAYLQDVPEPDYQDFWVTPDRLIFVGVEQPKDTYRLVLRMGGAQSNGVSAGWGNLVIVSPELVPDWGDIDALAVYTERFGLDLILGQKYFIEIYWMDTETGLTGESVCVSAICQEGSHVHDAVFKERNVLTQDNLILKPEVVDISFNVEAVSGSALLCPDISFEMEGLVTGFDGDLKQPQNLIPTGSYYSLSRGKGTRKFNICCLEVRVGSDSYQIAGRDGMFDSKSDVFGVVCWARR